MINWFEEIHCLENSARIFWQCPVLTGGERFLVGGRVDYSVQHINSKKLVIIIIIIEQLIWGTADPSQKTFIFHPVIQPQCFKNVSVKVAFKAGDIFWAHRLVVDVKPQQSYFTICLLLSLVFFCAWFKLCWSTPSVASGKHNQWSNGHKETLTLKHKKSEENSCLLLFKSCLAIYIFNTFTPLKHCFQAMQRTTQSIENNLYSSFDLDLFVQDLENKCIFLVV